MSKLSRIPPRDLEALSAFVDGGLSDSEARRVRARLNTEPVLREALDDLRLTRQILRRAPTLPVPRSFALSPAQAGVRQPSLRLPIVRLAATFATAAFLVVSGLDLLTGGLARGASAPEAEAPFALQAADSELAAPEATTESEAGVEAPAEVPPGLLAAPAGTPTPAPAERSLPADSVNGLGEEGYPQAAGGGPVAEPSAEMMLGAGLAQTPTAIGTEAPTPGETPTALPQPLPVAPASAEAPLWLGLSPLNWIEVVLGGAAACLILASILLRRYS